MSRIVCRYGENIDLCVPNKERHFHKCWEWINDPEVNRYLLVGVNPISYQEEQNWFDSAQGPTVVNFAIETKTEEYLGNAGLSRIDRQNNTAELGIILGNKEHWGKGYGSEAESMIITYGFRTLNLFKIFARIIERNKASIRAAEKAGMEQEAVLKKHFFREGKHLDVAVLSIFNS